MAWEDLLSTDYGLMSLGVIIFIIVMGIYLAKLFKSKMEEDASKAGK